MIHLDRFSAPGSSNFRCEEKFSQKNSILENRSVRLKFLSRVELKIRSPTSLLIVQYTAMRQTWEINYHPNGPETAFFFTNSGFSCEDGAMKRKSCLMRSIGTVCSTVFASAFRRTTGRYCNPQSYFGEWCSDCVHIRLAQLD